MSPAYELLTLADGHTDEARLHQLARSHRQARRARHSSRSYRSPLALVAWHERPVGVDLERVEACDRSFAESVCTPEESRRFRDRLDDPTFVTSLWSGKEALAKALGDALAYDPRRLESPLGWRDGAAGRWRALELRPAPGHVAWLVWEQPEGR